MKTIRELRKEAGVSQETLATILSGIRGGNGYQGPISNIERGEVSPTVKRLADILEALGYELTIYAEKRGSKPVKMDLGSLLGRSRAKNTTESDPSSSPSPLSQSQDTDQVKVTLTTDALETLLMGILKK